MRLPFLVRAALLTALAPSLLAAPQGEGATVPGFLLAGQSNMVGWGCSLELPPALRAPQPGVRIYNRCPGVEAWEVLEAGVNTNMSQCALAPSGWFGPEVSLGAALDGQYAETVHLIKFADGGTNLTPPAGSACVEDPGCFNPILPENSWAPDCGQLWDDLLATLDDAVAALAPGTSLEIQGIFWVQGTSDCVEQCHAAKYEERLGAFRDRLRTEIVARGLAPDTAIPFVLSQTPDNVYHWSGTGGFADPCSGCYVDVVRAAEAAVACTDPLVGLFDSSDSPLIDTVPSCGLPPDWLHFDAAGQKRQGEGLHQAFTTLHCPTLTADLSHIDLVDGGTQTLTLDDPAHAGLDYLVLGTLSGKEPGFTFAGVQIPANYDSYSELTLLFPAVAPIVGAAGVVDPAGVASLQVALPPASDPILAGLRAHHTLLLLGDAGSLPTLMTASDGVGLTLLP